MKRLLVISLFLLSVPILAEEDITTITLSQTGVTALKALALMNEICGTSVDAVQLLYPKKKVSFDFQDIPCDTAMRVLLKVDHRKP